MRQEGVVEGALLVLRYDNAGSNKKWNKNIKGGNKNNFVKRKKAKYLLCRHYGKKVTFISNV